jgi:hypothetical protein
MKQKNVLAGFYVQAQVQRIAKLEENVNTKMTQEA